MDPLLFTPSASSSNGSLAPRVKDSPAKVKDAATQFEGLLIAQMLKSARESTTGASGDEDHTDDSIKEMAEQQLSTILASSGGLGLSKLIVHGLEKPLVRPCVPSGAK